MKKIGLVFLFLIFLSANALATDYYVKTPANNGNDTNDGLAWTTAKATISAAMALVNGSDNIHVAAGTYNERVTFHASNSNQLLGGYPAAGEGTRAPWTNPTIISGTSLTGSVISIPGNFSTSVGYSGIVIDGFTVKNGSKSTTYGAGIESYSVGLTIKNCIVESNMSTGSGQVGGIYALALLNEPSTSLLRIEACIIRNNTGPVAGAILIDAISPFQLQLVNNLIYGNSSSNTTFLFGVGGVAIGSGAQTMASPPNNPKIINCTIANNTAAHPTKKVGGIGVNLDVGETVTIANSIIWHPGVGVDDIYAYNGETISISYSDVRDPADPGESGPGVIHSDPSFVSVSDYRLNAGSPCIDTGSNSVSGIPSTDLDGNSRIADGDSNGTATVDIGAYEKTAPADTTPPTGSVVINNGDTYTNTTSVTLALSATDPSGVTHMCINNTNSCSFWETYSTSKAWWLDTGDGTKTLYVWYRDGLGNENGTPYSDSIILDGTNPVDGGLSATPGVSQVSLSWSGFSDATSGIAGYTLVFDTTGTPNSCSEGTEIYAGTATAFLHTGLTNGTTYNYRICATDNAANTSTGATANATPAVVLPDTDTDGVPDAAEKGPAGNDPAYDGNGDGIPDGQQNNVASFWAFGGQGYVTLASPNGTSLSGVTAIDNPSPADAPPGVSFPFGFIEFVVHGVTAGGATTVTLYLPQGASPTTYYKYGATPNNPTPHWYEFLFDGTTGALINGNVITLHFVDGQRGDDDLTADGVIIDQGGPGISQTVIVPGYKNFGSVNLGSVSSQFFSLSNNGVTDLVITLIEFTGGDAGMFIPAAGGPSACSSLTPTIIPGGSCTFIVKFSPTSEGVKTTTLRITSSDPASPGDVTLDGTGTLAPVFNDCPDNIQWAENYINSIYYGGITAGCGAGMYCPGNNVTREQMAAFIVRAVEGGQLYEGACAGPSPFSDVLATSPFCRNIERLVGLGVTQGCAAGMYCPSNNVLRDQMAAFLARAFLGM